MSLEAWALVALQSLPVYKEDIGHPDKPAQLAMIAKAVTRAAKEARGWPGSRQQLIAAQIAIIKNETNASLRIHRNECKPLECDRGRAISLFQLHARPLTSPEVWPRLGFMTFDSTLLSAQEATRVLIRSRGLCASVNGDQIAMMFTAYAGRGCQLDRWRGWGARVETYVRVLRVPIPRAVAANDNEAQKQAS